jgi:hypothetical protein
MIEPGQTLYARLPRWACLMLLAAVAVLVLLPALPHPALVIPGERTWGAPAVETVKGDAALYQKIVADMQAGQGYYQAAAAEHRALHYPTAPAQVFRMPTLAWLLAALRFPVLQYAVLLGLYGVILVLFYREVRSRVTSLSARMGAAVFAVTGLSIVGVSGGVYWHEVWAALLIAASLLSYRAARWWPAVLCGLAACLIREIAAPYLLVMAGFVLWERRWKELFAWLAAMLVFAAAYRTHLGFAAQLYRPGDIVSSGWLAFGGWNFVLATAKWNILLHVLPYPLIALAVCAAVLGLAGAQEVRARRAAAIVAGYLTAFLVVGRPDNYYWGMLYTPLLGAGFLWAPAALRDLFSRVLVPLQSRSDPQ